MIDNLPGALPGRTSLTLDGHPSVDKTATPGGTHRMRALRILLIIAVILGGLFVAADRLAVHFAEGEVADRLKTQEGLTTTPSVDIKGFPFLTQVAGGELDDVEVGMKDYDADTGTSGRHDPHRRPERRHEGRRVLRRLQLRHRLHRRRLGDDRLRPSC